jgi:hypothetical protein
MHQPVFSREGRHEQGEIRRHVRSRCAVVRVRVDADVFTRISTGRGGSEQSRTGRLTSRCRTATRPRVPQAATITGCVVRDAANGGRPSITSNGIAYQLTGKSDNDLQRYLGKRLEVTGTLDSGRQERRATKRQDRRTTGAPKDQTATAGQSDVPTDRAERDNTAPRRIRSPRIRARRRISLPGFR